MSTPSILDNSGIIKLSPHVTTSFIQRQTQDQIPKKGCGGGCLGCSSNDCSTNTTEEETQKQPTVVKTVTTTWFSQDQPGSPIRTTTTTYYK